MFEEIPRTPSFTDSMGHMLSTCRLFCSLCLFTNVVGLFVLCTFSNVARMNIKVCLCMVQIFYTERRWVVFVLYCNTVVSQPSSFFSVIRFGTLTAAVHSFSPQRKHRGTGSQCWIVVSDSALSRAFVPALLTCTLIK